MRLRVLLVVVSSLVISFSANASSKRTEFEIKLKSSQTVRVTLQHPTQSSQSRLPVFLIFGGFEEAAKVLELIPGSVPAILASFDYPFSGHRRFRFPDSLADISRFKESIHLTLEAIEALVEVLKQRSDVNADQIAIVGASFGAPFAVRSAARIPEIDALVLVHGFAQVDRAIEHRLSQLWERRLGVWAQGAAWIVSRLAKVYLEAPEPEVDGEKLRSHQRAILIEAMEDTFIPKESREALLRSISRSQAKVQHVPMPGDHLQPGSEKLIGEIMEHVLKWLRTQGWRV